MANRFLVFWETVGGCTAREEKDGVQRGIGNGKDLRGTVRESVFVDYTRTTTLTATLDLFLHTPNYH